jgi:hypothetical protein
MSVQVKHTGQCLIHSLIVAVWQLVWLSQSNGVVRRGGCQKRGLPSPRSEPEEAQEVHGEEHLAWWVIPLSGSPQ